MLRINNTIFSLDILEKKFKCDLTQCMGNCCRYGDSGAPLSVEETLILDEIWEEVKPFLRPEGVAAIEGKGKSVKDFENENVTPLIGNEECAYTILNDNIFMCGIEQAWFAGKISFRKPLSCHLFPVRIKCYPDFKAVNYEELAICSPARNYHSYYIFILLISRSAKMMVNCRCPPPDGGRIYSSYLGSRRLLCPGC